MDILFIYSFYLCFCMCFYFYLCITFSVCFCCCLFLSILILNIYVFRFVGFSLISCLYLVHTNVSMCELYDVVLDVFYYSMLTVAMSLT